MSCIAEECPSSRVMSTPRPAALLPQHAKEEEGLQHPSQQTQDTQKGPPRPREGSVSLKKVFDQVLYISV
jgi:hypothetical protein